LRRLRPSRLLRRTHQMMPRITYSQPGRRLVRGFTVLATCASLGACSSLLEVKNPNNVGADALDRSEAAGAIISGAENSTARAMASIINPFTVASDETFWVGSRDAYLQIDTGNLSDMNNEYVN